MRKDLFFLVSLVIISPQQQGMYLRRPKDRSTNDQDPQGRGEQEGKERERERERRLRTWSGRYVRKSGRKESALPLEIL